MIGRKIATWYNGFPTGMGVCIGATDAGDGLVSFEVHRFTGEVEFTHPLRVPSAPVGCK